MCYTTLTKRGHVDMYGTLGLLIWFVSIWSKLPGSSTNHINYLTLGYVFTVCCCHWKWFYQISVPMVLQKVVGMPGYLKVVCNHSPRNYWLLSAINNSVDTYCSSSAAKWEMYWRCSETEAKSVVFMHRQKDILLSALNVIPLLRWDTMIP